MTIPPEAITAAALANDAFFDADGDLKVRSSELSTAMAKVMLEAAAPMIAAAERDRCIARLADRWPGTSRDVIADLLRAEP